jgi:hypothetical protein
VTGIIRLSGLPLWKRRTEMLMEILREGLVLLPGRDVGIDERPLNREFYRCIMETYDSRARRSAAVPDFAPVADAPNPALEIAETVAERTKPDIRWDLVDHLAGKGIAIISFAVECKRLGASTKSWKFNEEYAIHGVKRFVSDSHRYGENADSGAMVGYLQNMDYDKVLAEVNANLRSCGLPVIDAGKGDLHESEQELNRHFPITPYRLSHFWIDLRAVTAQGEKP